VQLAEDGSEAALRPEPQWKSFFMHRAEDPMTLTPGESQPSFTDLFDQLGLDSDPESIKRFLQQHAPLPEGIHVYDAAFWTPQQAMMLKEKLKCDDDWAIVVDQLSAALHERPDLDKL
jgi:uncharacterized protein involved in type VI secretion and phage assembly